MRLAGGALALFLTCVMSAFEAAAVPPPVTCAAARTRIETAIQLEQRHLGRGVRFVRNAQGHVVSYQGDRPIPPEEMRLLVRQALELLDGSANAMADSMARAAPSMPKMTVHDRGVWREWTKQTPSTAQALHAWVGQLGTTAPDYRTAQRNAAGWQKLSDDVLKLLEKYRGHVTADVAQRESNSALWTDLTADAGSVGLTAQIVAAAAAAAAGDLSAAARYSGELPDRIAAATALANCPAATPATTPAPSSQPPAPRAAPVTPPSAPHHGISPARKALAAAVGAGAGGVLLYSLSHIQPCCTPPPVDGGGQWSIVSYSPIVCSSAARQCSGSITINIPEAVSSGHPWAIAVDAGGNSYLGDARVSPTSVPGSVPFTLTKTYSGLNSCHPPIVRVGVGNGTTDNGMWATDVSYSLSCQ